MIENSGVSLKYLPYAYLSCKWNCVKTWQRAGHSVCVSGCLCVWYNRLYFRGITAPAALVFFSRCFNKAGRPLGWSAGLFEVIITLVCIAACSLPLSHSTSLALCILCAFGWYSFFFSCLCVCVCVCVCLCYHPDAFFAHTHTNASSFALCLEQRWMSYQENVII